MTGPSGLTSRAQHRLNLLLAKVQNGGLLALSEAAGLCDVSEMTVRRDIAASHGRLAVLGGHVIAVTEADDPYALDREHDVHLDDKVAACGHALALIEAGDTIFVDSGTTLIHLASRLPGDMDLTVVCFSMNVANILTRMPTIRWLLAGGLYESSTSSFSGEHGAVVLKDIRLNKAFISAGGAHPKLGASCMNFSEVAMKRAAIDNAAASYLVIDASKVNRVRPAYFADCSEFTAILTEHGRIRLG